MRLQEGAPHQQVRCGGSLRGCTLPRGDAVTAGAREQVTVQRRLTRTRGVTNRQAAERHIRLLATRHREPTREETGPVRQHVRIEEEHVPPGRLGHQAIARRGAAAIDLPNDDTHAHAALDRRLDDTRQQRRVVRAVVEQYKLHLARRVGEPREQRRRVVAMKWDQHAEICLGGFAEPHQALTRNGHRGAP
jgi:hypothetical protein